MGERIALVVANLHHRDEALARLPTAAANVDLLASLLNDPEIGNFDHVTVLVDETAETIQAHIRDFFRLRLPYDLLLFYLIGPGLFDQAGELYFPTIDTQYEALAYTAVSATYIADWMDRSFSRRKMLFLDSHFGRAAASELVGPESAAVGVAFQGNGQWRTVVSRSNEITYALTAAGIAGEGGDIGEAAAASFTNAYINGLQTGEADLNGDTLIGLGELFEYISDRLAQEAAAPEPHIWRYGERDDLAFLGRRVGKAGRPIKWDLLIGGLSAPLLIVLVGGRADPRHAGVMALLFVAFYTLLYIFLED